MAAQDQYKNSLQQAMQNFNEAGYDADNYQFGSFHQDPASISSPGVSGNYTQNYVASDSGYYPTNDFYGYYYPGYNGLPYSGQAYYNSADGLNIQYPVAQVDNSQFLHYNPWYNHGYDALASVPPGSIVGIDGQIVANQPAYTGTAFQQPSSRQVHYPSPAYGTNFFSPNTVDGAPLGVKSTDRSRLVGGVRPLSKSSPSLTHPTAPVKVAPKYRNFSDKEDKRFFNASRNQPIKSDKAAQHITTLPHSTALAKGYIPMARFPEKDSVRYYSTPNNTKGSELFGPERLKGRNKVNGTSYDSIFEQNHGPRLTGQKVLPPSNSYSTGQGDGNKIKSTFREGQYNLPEFQTAYEKARFFVIKSYNEDDVHKSIKYDVWCSTPKGNKKLDLAYQDAQKKVEEKSSKSPVFLFFSVNVSGHFCGVAEMTSGVNFEKNMDFWLQDKWTGVFPVKWHIIKDVPHSQFRHIKLENNDYQPVTSSRDTQEVKLEKGIEMLNIFKNYSAKTSIRDDFGFYENREKLMHGEKILPSAASSTNVRKSVDGRDVTEAGAVKIDPNHPADESVSVGNVVVLNDTLKDVDPADERVSGSKDVELKDTTKDVDDGHSVELNDTATADEGVSGSKDVELKDTTKDVDDGHSVELNDTAKDVGGIKTISSEVVSDVELNDSVKDVGDIKTISSDEVVSVSKDAELNDSVKDVGDLKTISSDEVVSVSNDAELNDSVKDVGDLKTFSADEVSSVSEDVELNETTKHASDTKTISSDEVVSVSKDAELNSVKGVGDLKTYSDDEVSSVSEDVELNETTKHASDIKTISSDEVVSMSKDAELNDSVKGVGDLKTYSADEASSEIKDVELNDTAKVAGDTFRVAEDGDVKTDHSNPPAEVVSVTKDVELKDTAND